MSVDNSRRFTKEIKVKKSLAKCPSFVVKEEIRNQVEHCSYRSFQYSRRCMECPGRLRSSMWR
jgi:hypothetical protein